MKLRTEKPAKPNDTRLKFFTRELYSKFCSEEDAIANDADEEWEEAIEAYKRHLRRIEKRLPKGARALEKISLHDAYLIGDPATSGDLGRIAVAGGLTNDQSTIH